MKRIFAIVLLIIVSVNLYSCDPDQYIIEPESVEKVESIELIEYNNPDQNSFFSWVPNHFDDLKPFNFSYSKVIETLPDEKISDFLSDFSESYILHTYYAYDSPSDVCIKVNYSNGNFLIIWANYSEQSYGGYIGIYSPDGEVLEFWGSFSGLNTYEHLVNNYFEYKI